MVDMIIRLWSCKVMIEGTDEKNWITWIGLKVYSSGFG